MCIPILSQDSKIKFPERWRYRQECFPSSNNQKKENDQFKNKNEPALPEKH